MVNYVNLANCTSNFDEERNQAKIMLWHVIPASCMSNFHEERTFELTDAMCRFSWQVKRRHVDHYAEGSAILTNNSDCRDCAGACYLDDNNSLRRANKAHFLNPNKSENWTCYMFVNILKSKERTWQKHIPNHWLFEGWVWNMRALRSLMESSTKKEY